MSAFEKRGIIRNNQASLIHMFVILAFSLAISAIIFFYIGQENIIQISYNNIKKMSYLNIFIENLIRNIFYFLIVAVLVLFGHKNTVYVLFFVVNLYFGISIIYVTKIFVTDKMYLLYNIFDYIIYYPLLFFFTYISTIISNSIKKSKKIKTNIKKIDIITLRYFRVVLILIIILAIYSLLYSYYLYLLL